MKKSKSTIQQTSSPLHERQTDRVGELTEQEQPQVQAETGHPDKFNFSATSLDNSVQPANSIQRITNTKARQQAFQKVARNVGNRQAAEIARTYQNTKANNNSRPAQNVSMLMRWDSFEHVALGEYSGGVSTQFITLESHKRDLPQHKQPIWGWPKEWQVRWQAGTKEQKRMLAQGLTYGEVLALSGDFYQNFEALNQASLLEIYDLIPFIRGNTASTSQLEAATGGRYLALAKQNESHFSNVAPGHRNIDKWRANHIQAILAAKQGNANLAWAMNAAGDHYLTDAFSGGHVRTPRDKLMGSSTGDVKSKILHDRDNEHGVEVTNQRGDTWRAYGDDVFYHPFNIRNKQLVEEAVRLSKQDIADALSQGESYPTPQLLTVFEAEKLVPYPINAAQNNKSGNDLSESATDLLEVGGRVAGLAKNELPGMAFGKYDDTLAREWVARQSNSVLAAMPIEEKLRMINRLLDGWISDDDVAAIIAICKNVPSAQQLQKIHAEIAPRLSEIHSNSQRSKVQMAISHQN